MGGGVLRLCPSGPHMPHRAQDHTAIRRGLLAAVQGGLEVGCPRCSLRGRRGLGVMGVSTVLLW